MGNTTESGPDRLELSAVVERQERSLDRLLDWIKAIDSKTPIVIGLATTMLAVIVALSPAPDGLSWGRGLLLAMAGLPLLGCLGFCAAANFPHTDGPESSQIFFGGICKIPFEKYAREVGDRTPEQYLGDLNRQCFRNAQIATAKYRAVQRAFLALLVSTPLWLIACYLLYKGW